MIYTFFFFSMKTGLREYAKFVQSRQEDSENIMVCDPRSSEEQTNAANILAAARIYAECELYL